MKQRDPKNSLLRLFWFIRTWRKLAGRSRTADIFWSLRWRARRRPFVSRCLAVSDRMWSSNVSFWNSILISKIRLRKDLFWRLFSWLTNSYNERSFVLRKLLNFQVLKLPSKSDFPPPKFRVRLDKYNLIGIDDHESSVRRIVCCNSTSLRLTLSIF